MYKSGDKVKFLNNGGHHWGFFESSWKKHYGRVDHVFGHAVTCKIISMKTDKNVGINGSKYPALFALTDIEKLEE